MQKNKSKRGFKIAGIVLLCLLAILLLLAAAVLALRAKGKSELLVNKPKNDGQEEIVMTAPVLPEETVGLEDDGQTVTYKGTKYRYNENLTSVLFMGVDRKKLNDGSDRIGEGGQADMVLLAVMDTVTGKTTLLNISRDSMIDVNVYNVANELVGMENMQLCLAYAYGDGRDSSCKNMIRSVQRLLYGMPIQSYVALDLAAIKPLNDAIGGVEVTVLEDPALDPKKFPPGEKMLLKGDKAVTYVRTRTLNVPGEPFDTNKNRMARQKQYMMAFIQKALQETKQNLMLPIDLYQLLKEDDNMVTNLSMSKVAYLATSLLNIDFSEIKVLTVPGEIVMGEEYAEFHVDDAALYEMILNTFYEKVK